MCSVVRLTGSYRPCLSRFLISSSRHIPFPRLSFTPVHFSSPGGLVPRAGKKGECWTFLDWRLNSENDSPVHGQPSSITTRLVTLPVSRHRLTRSLVGPIPSGLLMSSLPARYGRREPSRHVRRGEEHGPSPEIVGGTGPRK